MKIILRNLGPMRQAEFDIGDMTIICGLNNTGKTYATYAFHGFLSYWREAFSMDIPKDLRHDLWSDGAAELDLNYFVSNAQAIIRKACTEYTKRLPRVFASSQKYFDESRFNIEITNSEIQLQDSFNLTMGTAKTKLISVSKKPKEEKAIISFLVEEDKRKVPIDVFSKVIGDTIKQIVFGAIFPNSFIASAERTGAAIFRNELNFARNRLLEELGELKTEINVFDFFRKGKAYSGYALPIRENVDFIRELESIAKDESELLENDPSVLEDFANIIGGEYTVSRNDDILFIPRANRRRKLAMNESSSSVRSLLDVGFYLRHAAERGDLLIIDEPELNLHPENQRLIARLLARLMNAGIKVFITTHSDYIIRELSTLIMLNNAKPHLKKIMEHEGYRNDELLSASRLKVYVAELALIMEEGARRRRSRQTLTSAKIDPEMGIDARSFDKTIEDMNRVQDEIVWGGE